LPSCDSAPRHDGVKPLRAMPPVGKINRKYPDLWEELGHGEGAA
jgi:hypothetical protein